jgi:hypothetical protein
MPSNEAIKLSDQLPNKKFLPIEAFDPCGGVENPDELIGKYRDEATGQTLGLSKWNYANGTAELRKCTVL